jgi:hypothetical protein
MEIIDPLYWDEDVLGSEGVVIHHKGDEVAITDRYTPEFVAMLVDITNVTPKPDQRWTYDGKAFTPPA